MTKYFEYKLGKSLSKRYRCIPAAVVDCTAEKALSNCEKHRKLVTLLDEVWDEYAKSKNTRHGREYSI